MTPAREGKGAPARRLPLRFPVGLGQTRRDQMIIAASLVYWLCGAAPFARGFDGPWADASWYAVEPAGARNPSGATGMRLRDPVHFPPPVCATQSGTCYGAV